MEPKIAWLFVFVRSTDIWTVGGEDMKNKIPYAANSLIMVFMAFVFMLPGCGQYETEAPQSILIEINR